MGSTRTDLPKLAIVAIFATLLGRTTADGTGETGDAPSKRIFTMCVPEIYWKDCAQMVEDSGSKGIPIACVTGRDRYECIEKVGTNAADVVAVDPEDMYLVIEKNRPAGEPGYSVVEQVRTKEEPEAPYRYEAVAVVRKDLEARSVQELRGLKSCHTGVGRNVGYKIPIAKLTAMGVLRNLNDPEYSARENELRALSSLFSKGCLVGTWSPDPAIDRRLKETYSNMCALCEKPDICDYPDVYSGYEGALRCLVHNGGDVAWTKVIYVKRFFGLPVGVSAAVPTSENPSEFRYLCPDGSKVPIDGNTKPCTWAARPWQGYMVHEGVGDVPAMQKELTDLGKLGEAEKADWWRDLMLLNEKTVAVPASPVDPDRHLTDAKYLDVIERNAGAPERSARWCVTDRIGLLKCRALAKAAFSRDVRPRLDCVLERDEEACLRAVRDGGADLTVLDGGKVRAAVARFNLVPILAESYGRGSTEFGERPAVAVVRTSGRVNGFADLRGKRSCHSGYRGDFAGWTAPVHALVSKGLVRSEDEIEGFFDGSCAPGAPTDSALCRQCVGNVAANDDRVKDATKCRPTTAEAYNGGKGALECLRDGKGDVAFLPLTALEEAGNASSPGGKISDLALLCPDGGVAAPGEWRRCNLGLEPPRTVLGSAAKSVHALEELTHGTLAASSLYAEEPDLLRLFGTWAGQPNVLFRNDAKGLVSVDSSWDKWATWEATRRDYATAR